MLRRNGNRGVTQPRRQAPVPIGGGLLGDESCQEVDVGPVLESCLFGQGGERCLRGGEVEVAEVGFDLFVETHAITPPSSLRSMSSG